MTLNNELRTKAVEQVAAGIPLRHIADDLGVGLGTVSRWAKADREGKLTGDGRQVPVPVDVIKHHLVDNLQRFQFYHSDIKTLATREWATSVRRLTIYIRRKAMEDINLLMWITLAEDFGIDTQKVLDEYPFTFRGLQVRVLPKDKASYRMALSQDAVIQRVLHWLQDYQLGELECND